MVGLEPTAHPVVNPHMSGLYGSSPDRKGGFTYAQKTTYTLTQNRQCVAVRTSCGA